MTQLSLVEVLDDLSGVRTTLLACKTRDQVIQTALSLVRERLRSQTASIFIFSKDGRLERAGIQGIDIDGKPISNEWFPEESYEVGESFTGKVTIPRKGSLYGEPQWFNTVQDKDLIDKSYAEYSRKIGKIDCAIGVPLNGQNRTFGVLEIINKLYSDGANHETSCSSFSTEEIYWLDALGANVATSISNLRRNNQIKMLTDLGHLLVGSSTDSNLTFQNIGKLIVREILNPDTSFKVCILRIGIKPNTLEVVAKDKVKGVSWEGRVDQSRDYGKGVVGEAAASGKPVIVENLEDEIHRFNNREWIRKNHLGSFACIPLVNEDEIVGTISLFSGYNYIFHDSIINLLKSLASLIASFVHREISSGELKNLEHQLSEERNARFISGYSLSREDILHEYKNELLVLQNVFRELRGSSGGKNLRIIDNQISWTEERVRNIKGQFEEYVPIPVDINTIIQEIIRYFSHTLRSESRKIHFEQEFDKNIPRIMANPVEMKEVIRNVISNAIKSIQKTEKNGEIKLITTIIESKGVDYVQVIVEDNGDGIKNEIKDEIFKKGFTTRGNEGGTGIGLFVSRKIINKYGGQILYDSVVGKGTQFIVRLPLRLQEI